MSAGGVVGRVVEPSLEFTLPPELEAHAPPEARGLARDEVRMLVGVRASGAVNHHRFSELPALLRAGDLLVVNTSATLPAALDLAGGLAVHVSTRQADGRWVVELRRDSLPCRDAAAGQVYRLRGGAELRLAAPYTDGRLWVAEFDVPVLAYLEAHGRPILYGYVDREWPLSAYQTVFATHPGSAEMPSAGRPFPDRIVSRLVARGVVIAPITLHTGVASLQAHEKPYPEWFDVPAATARLVNDARAAGVRVIAVGTTVVRALESAVDVAEPAGTVRAASGWTSLVVTPAGDASVESPAVAGTGVHAVDGLLTGFHEPRASHLAMLEAVAGRSLLSVCYREAMEAGYLWHEFGDVNLLLP